MNQKSLPIAMILGLFSLGGFYVAGVKKGALLFLGMCVLYFILGQISPNLSLVGIVVSEVVTYKWLKEHNEGTVEEGTPQHM